MADFLQQGLPAATTPALAGPIGLFAQFWFRFMEALWKRCGQGGNSDIVFSNNVLPLTATKGFFICPTCAGTPTGVPDQLYDGQTALIYDSTNSILYAYTGAGPWTAV